MGDEKRKATGTPIGELIREPIGKGRGKMTGKPIQGTVIAQTAGKPLGKQLL